MIVTLSQKGWDQVKVWEYLKKAIIKIDNNNFA